MITLHYLNDSRAQRILWLCVRFDLMVAPKSVTILNVFQEELSIPYILTAYQRDTTFRRAPQELTGIEPLGKSPSIVDSGEDGTKSIVLGESGAIVRALV